MTTIIEVNAQTIEVANALAGLATQISELQILVEALISSIPTAPPPPPPPAPPGPSTLAIWSAVDNLYTRFITSEHQKPKFIASVALSVQAFVDSITLAQNIPGLYDLNVCVGEQEDIVGQWVGITRYLNAPISGVYFSWDTPSIGWDEGTWWSTFNPITELDSLPDDSYRTLLIFKIAANQWDGTIPGAYEIFNNLFILTGLQILIQDNGNMTMIFAILGGVPDAVFLSLFSQGELILRPAGVSATLMSPAIANTPYFGFDVENSSISGWDTGAWGVVNAQV